MHFQNFTNGESGIFPNGENENFHEKKVSWKIILFFPKKITCFISARGTFIISKMMRNGISPRGRNENFRNKKFSDFEISIIISACIFFETLLVRIIDLSHP